MADPQEVPFDGYGGELYQINFPVPVYDTSPETFQTLSWEQIDLFYQSNASSTVLSTIAFTVCLVSLLYTITLAPASKRRRLIHIFLILALVSKLVDRAMAISLLLHSPDVSAYISLTLDVDHMQLSSSFRARAGTLHTGAMLTFGFLQACLYLHGEPLLTIVKLKSRATYHAVLIFLITAAVIAFALRLALAIFILRGLNQFFRLLGSPSYQAVYQASLIMAAISIGGWSLVFFCSAMCILRSRRQFGRRSKMYDTVLQLIAVIGLESFILPLTFAVLQLAPTINSLLSNSPEVLLVPSVLLVLPLASLFSTTRNDGGLSQELPGVNLRFVPGAAAAAAAAVSPIQLKTTTLQSQTSKKSLLDHQCIEDNHGKTSSSSSSTIP